MSTPPKSRHEQPSTYFVLDHSNRDEMTRLQVQGQLLTASMGGVLPELPDPTIFHRVLDVGCGTGSWLIEAAKAYPTMAELVGIDVSNAMLEYARTQAKAQQVEDRVQFCSMDALRSIEFPNESFDLVNQRLGMSYIRTWDWPKLLDEYQRITRPGGVIRITECDISTQNNSPAYTYLIEVARQAMGNAGLLFHNKCDGVIEELPHLFNQYGHSFEHVQTRSYLLEYRAGTPEGEHFAEDIRLAYRTLAPFLRKWTRVPEDYEEIYQQMVKEMQQPDFVATWKYLTVWAHKKQ
jgi:ubiquinone/menaquinone biosynthesis C-methylase UbiE